MKVCFYGSFNPAYDRNWGIIQGVKSFAKVEVLNSRKPFLQRSILLFFQALKEDFDVLFVLYPGHLDVFTARAVCWLKRKPLVFDKFVSQMDSEIEYGNIEPGSMIARWHFFIDWLGAKCADKVFLDTPQHAEFFSKTFKMEKSKVSWFFVGANEDFFSLEKKRAFLKKAKRKRKGFTVLYYGISTPFHGFETICQVAELLSEHKGIMFEFVGDSKYYRLQREKYSGFKSMSFLPTCSLKELSERVFLADACLGVFGSTPKLERVIPLKVVEPLACGKALITSDSKAVRKLLSNSKHALLVEKNSPQALAKAILKLKNAPSLIKRLEKNSAILYERVFSAKAVSKAIFKELNSLNYFRKVR